MMGLLDKTPKAFWVGVSVASLICVVILVIHNIVVANSDDTPSLSEQLEQIRGPIAEADELKPVFSGATSHLGFYARAAASTDARPCAKIATDVMKRNGTVIDAAIAALFCNGVFHAQSMGIGGGFVMTIYKREEQKAYTLMAREVAPRKATKNMFADNKESSFRGPLAIAVPGELLGYHEAKQRFGNPDVTFSSLVEPSIQLCEEGLEMSPSMANIGGSTLEALKNNSFIRHTFMDHKSGTFFKPGSKYKRPILAQTLRRIAQNGAEEIYGPHGETGKKLVEDIQTAGGIIEREDLLNYRVRWEDPVSTILADNHTVFTSPPPSSGPVLAGILNTLSRFELTPKDASDPVSIQRFVEACKYGFAKRTLIGDWAEETEDNGPIHQLVDTLTSEDWARTTRHLIRDDWTSSDASFYGADLVQQPVDGGTAHLSFIAPNGDAVAVTSTINSYFGSHVVSESTGIVLNNEMDDFSSPGFANVYGIAPSKANFIKPGRRPVSSMVPTIITDKLGDVKLIVGAAGGPKIITSTAFVSMQHLWFGKNVKEAIDEKRWHHQLLPMKAIHDIGAKEEVVKYLTKVGHQVESLPPHLRGSVVQGIAVESRSIVTANNDLRKYGGVDGF